MENFVLYDEIGKANDQTIYKSRRKGTIKYLAISCADRQRRSLISNHVRIVHVLKHPNILQFHEWYETSNHLWIVMELCTGGSLEKVVKEDKCLPESVVRQFGSGIVRGLDYLHSRGVIFNETRPSRILLDGNGNAKLFDFSWAHLETESLDEVLSRFSDDEFCETSPLLEPRNITVYTAPETISSGKVSMVSDYRGLGCLLYYMCSGSLPFGADVNGEFTRHASSEDFDPSKMLGKRNSRSFISLLDVLMVKSPSQRISASELVKHEFWQNCLDDLDSSSSTAEQLGTDELGNTTTQDKFVENTEALHPLVNGENTVGQSIADDDDANNHANTFPEQPVVDTPMGSATGELHVEGANFTLHANSNATANPVVPSQLNVKMKETDTSGVRIRQKDGLQVRDMRMVKSEYHDSRESHKDDQYKPIAKDFREEKRSASREEKELKSIVEQNLDDLRCEPRPFPMQLSADLAATYPWGDESPSLPHDTLLLLRLSDYLRGAQTELGGGHMDYPSTGTGWRPRPLMDYTRLTRTQSQRQTAVEGLTEQLTDADFRFVLASKVKMHITEVINLFRTHGPESAESIGGSRFRRTPSLRATGRTTWPNGLVSYLIWLMASTTSGQTSRPSVTVAQPESANRTIGIQLIPELFVELVRRLKSAPVSSASAQTSDVRTELCQLCGLLAHRIACIRSLGSESKSTTVTLTQTAVQSIGTALPLCLSALIDLLREPITRTGPRLRQVAVLALGECVTCVIRVLCNAIHEAQLSGIRTGVLVEMPVSQWNTVVHHLLKCLLPNTGTTPPSTDTDIHQRDGKGVERPTEPSIGTNTRVTEWHVRLSAARAIDAFVTAAIGCRVHDLPVTGSLSALCTACVSSLATVDVVSQIWNNGLGSGGAGRMTGRTTQTTNSLQQETSLSCANALAGIMLINPHLFTTGLIDRIGSDAFTALLEPPAGGLAMQQTSLVVRLLSIAATGLLIPLSIHATSNNLQFPGSQHRLKRHSSVIATMRTVNTSNAPAACRRLLTDARFTTAVFRHLKSPHAMLRAKAYLLGSAILFSGPKESFPVAFDAQVPALLERDLKATNGFHDRFPSTQTNFNSSPSPVTRNNNASSGSSASMVYLTACTLHFSDLLVSHLIPLICQQLLLSLGCTSPGTATVDSSTRSAGARRPSRVTSRNTGMTTSAILPSTPTGISNPSAARAWLPAYACLPTLLNTCCTVRDLLFYPANTEYNTPETSNGFCLLSFIAKLLDLWASVDPMLATATTTAVHQPGSVENQLLNFTLMMTEDLSQQSELVEQKRRELVCLVLPGLARLAVAPRSRPETRAICVKIVSRLAEVLLGECERSSSTHSLIDLDRQFSGLRKDGTSRSKAPGLDSLPERPLSVDVDLLLKEIDNPSSYMRSEESLNNDSMTRSHYGGGTQLDGGSRETPRQYRAGAQARTHRANEKRRNAGTIGAALQSPTPDVLGSLFEVVNKLMIPYADRLVQCAEVTAATAFIRLLNLLLSHVPPTQLSKVTPDHANNPTGQGDCIPSDRTAPEDSYHAASCTLVANLGCHGLDVAIVRVFASQLLSPLDTSLASASSIVTNAAHLPRSHSSAGSTLCSTLFLLVPHLLRWPRESRPSYLIVELRLLELVSIACLELGEFLFPISNRSSSNTTGRPSSKDGGDAQSGRDSPVVQPMSPRAVRKPQSKLSPSKPNLRGRNAAFRKAAPPIEPPTTSQLHAPMLHGLKALNTLLAHVAQVVRIALAARTTCCPEGETAAMAAEEILVASRPPPAMAGLLARLVGLWRPRSNHPSNSVDTEKSLPNDPEEEELCFQLCDASITSLTHFASLYGGEYSRSALLPPEAASLSLGLLRLAAEDRRNQDERGVTHKLGGAAPLASSDGGTPPCPLARRRMRLLLRIIRRLVTSDAVCRSRLAVESLEHGVTNLYTTLQFLLCQMQRHADSSTAKLLREIIDQVSSSGTCSQMARVEEIGPCQANQIARKLPRTSPPKGLTNLRTAMAGP